MTLVSAPAGFGKTTLVSEWVAGCNCPAAWLSLDEADNDPVHFLTYIMAALQRINSGDARIGDAALGMLKSPQTPATQDVLASLINELALHDEKIILILDDYHLVDARPTHEALSFLIENLPEKLHIVISTREDPLLPLPRLRARDQLTELRAADLCFSNAEAAQFLNQVMGTRFSWDSGS
jgi:LuxR family maltose regulon positive regulatory protein